jgi:hypothetical protein
MTLKMGTHSRGLVWGPTLGSYDHGNELSGFITGREFLLQLHKCLVFKREPAQSRLGNSYYELRYMNMFIKQFKEIFHIMCIRNE